MVAPAEEGDEGTWQEEEDLWPRAGSSQVRIAFKVLRALDWGCEEEEEPQEEGEAAGKCSAEVRVTKDSSN